jgi:arsenate reductase
MAEAFFNLMADPSQAQAMSAGTAPGTRIHPEVQTAMSEVGGGLSKAKPQLLTTELASGAR